MMSSPLVSIVIPIYNGEKKLADCLKSILEQDYKDLEILVVDNNSIDQTKQVINTFMDQDNRIKYFFETYRSRGAARNLGCKMAQGEIIAMTDVDCVVPSSWISRMIEPIVFQDYLAVQGAEENIDYRAKYLRPVFNKQIIVGRINTNNFFISKEVLVGVGSFDRKFFRGEDTELSVRLEQFGLRVKFLDVTVKHLRTYSLVNNLVKFYEGGYWCAQVTKKHYQFLRNHQFLKDSNQTFWFFIKFFPGLIKTLVLEGPIKAWHELVTGSAWRAGLINGWLK